MFYVPQNRMISSGVQMFTRSPVHTFASPQVYKFTSLLVARFKNSMAGILVGYVLFITPLMPIFKRRTFK